MRKQNPWPYFATNGGAKVRKTTNAICPASERRSNAQEVPFDLVGTERALGSRGNSRIDIDR
jgi:hypothetical protein